MPLKCGGAMLDASTHFVYAPVALDLLLRWDTSVLRARFSMAAHRISMIHSSRSRVVSLSFSQPSPRALSPPSLLPGSVSECEVGRPSECLEERAGRVPGPGTRCPIERASAWPPTARPPRTPVLEGPPSNADLEWADSPVWERAARVSVLAVVVPAQRSFSRNPKL